MDEAGEFREAAIVEPRTKRHRHGGRGRRRIATELVAVDGAEPNERGRDRPRQVRASRPPRDAAAVEAEPPPAADTAGIGDDEMLEIVSQAIEAGRVDLYLQPTVTLPERRPRYFEAFTRIRTKADTLILSALLSTRGRSLRHDAADRQRAVGEERADAAAARLRLAHQGRVLQHLGQHPARPGVLSRSWSSSWRRIAGSARA